MHRHQMKKIYGSLTFYDLQFDKDGWVKPWWQIVGLEWSPIFPSPILSLNLGFLDPDDAIQEMLLSFWEWEVLTFDIAPVTLRIPVWGSERIDYELIPQIVFYNKEKSYIRVFTINFMYLIKEFYSNNFDPMLRDMIINYLNIPPNYPLQMDGTLWFIDWDVKVEDPKNATLKMFANSNTGVIPGYHTLDRRDPSISATTELSTKINGRKFIYYADFPVAYDDVVPFFSSTLSFQGSFEMLIKGSIDLGIIEFRPSLKFKANADKHTISLPGIQNPNDPTINKPYYNDILGTVTMINSPVIESKYKINACPLHKKNCPNSHSYKLNTLPSEWLTNNNFSINPEPENMQMGLEFIIRKRNILFPHPIFNTSDYPFFILKKTTSSSGYTYYHFETEMVSPDLLHNLVIHAEGATISDLKIKVRASFDYLDNPIIQPYIFERAYSAIILPPYKDNNNTWEMNHKVITTTQTLSNISSNTKYFVSNGATLTVSNVTFNSNTGNYGFSVNNGKIVFNNCTFLTNVDFIEANGLQSEIIFQNCSNPYNNIKKINIVEGGKLHFMGNNTINIVNGELTFSGNGSNIIKNANSKINLYSSVLKVLNGSQILINNDFLHNLTFMIAKGLGTEIVFDNLHNLGTSKNIQLLDGAKLYINGTKVKIVDGALDMSGQGTKIVLNNNSEIFLSGTNMNVSDSATIDIAKNSSLIVNYDSVLSLDNYSVINVAQSEILMSVGNLHLNNNSKVYFQDSFFQTANRSRIVGHIEGLWIDLGPEITPDTGDDTSLLLNVGSNYFDAKIKGDRIEFRNSRVRMEHNTVIISGSEERWDGLYFYDCPRIGDEPDYNILRGEVSGIRYIYLNNSFLDLNRVDITDIRQIYAHNSSTLFMHGSSYHENTLGIHVTDMSFLNIWDSDIYKNEYGVFLENSPYAENSIRQSRIHTNDDVGILVINSYLFTAGNEIHNNLKGYVAFSSNPLTVRDGTISNNTFVETAFRRENYPYFYINTETNKRPEIGNNESNASFLMMALGNSNRIVNTNQAVVDTTDVTRFYPSISVYQFNNPMPSPAKELYELSIDNIASGDFQQAMENMFEIIDLYPETDYAIDAVRMLPNLQVTIGTEVDELLDYLDNIESTNLISSISEIKAVTNMYNMRFSQAIEGFDLIIEQLEDTIESLFAELNREYMIWKQAQEAGSRVAAVANEHYNKERYRILSKILNFNIDEENLDEKLPVIESLAAHNYPNPFNPETTIRFSVPTSGNVKIDIYNIRGQRVTTLLNETLNYGHHSAVWNGTDSNGRSVGSGVYFYRIHAGGENVTNRMLLMK